MKSTLGDVRHILLQNPLSLGGKHRRIVDDSLLDPAVFDAAAATFGVLDTPARTQVLWLLARGERDVRRLAERTGESLLAVSQHLTELHRAGLITAHGRGGRRFYVVDDPHVVNLICQAVDHHTGSRLR
ncbi:MAG TPA: metalloregulator ArsR/SmtB family transcription factor [Mycobacteriales bacterium]|nr:metalloregulator ArsR/SmtB family transcription factor [Mycobacteriales bacterium]